MGVCFSEDEKKEKISNAKITKVYNFDNKNVDNLDIDEFIPEETVKLFTAKQNKLSEPRGIMSLNDPHVPVLSRIFYRAQYSFVAS